VVFEINRTIKTNVLKIKKIFQEIVAEMKIIKNPLFWGGTKKLGQFCAKLFSERVAAPAADIIKNLRLVFFMAHFFR